MVRDANPTPSGHQFTDIHISGSGNHLGDSYSYHYTGDDPQKELEKKVDACRNDLLLTDPLIDLETLKSTKGQRTRGTCEWIRENETYKSWLHGDSQCLWICGGPGKGKTMISIFLTEELERHTKEMDSTQMLFYFCSHQDEKRNSAVTVLRSLVYQMLTKRRDMFASVSSYFESAEKTRMTLSSPDTLWVILRTLIQSKLSTTFCVLDGLDECDDASLRLLTTKFRDYFSSSHSTQSNGGLKLAIVGRPISGLEVFPQVKLDPDNDEQVSGDIQQFISASVQELEKIPGFDKIRQKVETTLMERAKGTFLWVGFVIAELSKKHTCTGIEESLEDLPPGLPAIYSRMLLQAKRSWETESKERTVIREILCWVTTAVRPLKLQELTTAIAISTEISNEQTIRDQITLCEPILKIQDLEVSLVHQSAREYLLLRETPDNDSTLEEFRIKGIDAHAELARTCMDYIEKSDLCHEFLNIEDASVLQKSPLLNYAALHWLEHARFSSTHADKDYSLSRPLFQEKSLVRVNWWEASGEARRHFIFDDQRSDLPLLYITCYYGIDALARKLLRKALHIKLLQLIHGSDKQVSTALQFAASGGHKAIVQLLLAKGADVNGKDRGNSTALNYATQGGHEAIVQLLLANGADVNAKDRSNGTALNYASQGGHEAIVQLLLANGADVNGKDRGNSTALNYAAWRGNEAIVQLLLANGADVNAKDRGNGTALNYAAQRGHEAIVQLLLANGADVNAKDRGNGTPLHHAAQGGHEAIVQLLLANGADVNRKDRGNSTALHHAAQGGHEALLQLLLAKGADVNGKDRGNSTALHHAAQGGHEAIVQLLLAKGADVNRKDRGNSTALHHAAQGGHEAIVQLLLAKGADVNWKDRGNGTALHHAAQGGHEAIVQLLLAKGADVNAKDRGNGTALHHAAWRGHEAIVQLLLAKGADVNARNGEALRQAAEGGHKAIVQLLLANGADVNAKERGNSTALHHAAQGGHEAIMQLLLTNGSDVNAKDRGNSTALHHAAQKGHEAIVQLLLAKDADVNAKDRDNGTALIEAAWGGHETIVQLLLAKGADVNTKDQDDSTALDHAARRGHEAIVQLLESAGAS